MKRGKHGGVPYSFGKSSGTKGKGKCINDSDFNPIVLNSESLVDTVIGVGESGTKKSRVGFKMKSNPPQDTLLRDIREWTNTSEKGQGHSQPKGRGKGKGKGKRKHPGKGHHNQDQAGSPNEETGQRTLGDFGMKRQRVEFVRDVQVNDVFETPRVDRAAYVLCVQKCKSVVVDSAELPSSSTRVFSGLQE